MRWSSRHHVEADGGRLAVLVVVALLLFGAAGVGMSYVAGFDAVHAWLAKASWPWLVACAGGLLVAYARYHVAYRGVSRVDGGPRLDERALRAVAAASFGGFLAHGESALDAAAMRAGGAAEREVKVRVTALSGFEQGVLAVGASAAAIAVLATGMRQPPPDFTLPWAIVPAIGFGVAFWAAERHRARLRGHPGWRGRTAIFLDAVQLTRQLFLHPRRTGWALAGMATFWAGEIFTLWAAMAAVGFRMNAAAVIVAAATGMLFTRRVAPLAGAGLLILCLAPTLWYSGAPWGAAVLGACAYGLLSLLGPMPFALRALPRLRAVVREGDARSPASPGARAATG